MLLEGVRLATGNNPFTFPPTNYVTSANESIFQTPAGRAEYCILVDSTDPAAQALEIADPTLQFIWTRNDTGATRFAWNGFHRRWLPSPGAGPDVIGPLSNTTRLIALVPDPSLTSAPFSFYLGNPTRLLTFSVSVVPSASSFSAPSSLASGQLEIAQDTGQLNFSATDASIYNGQTVYGQRQNFFDPSKNTGAIGALPASASLEYFLFLNPLPASGSIPRVRIGYAAYLIAIQVPTEADLGTPAPGTFTWSLDTGRIQLNTADVAANLGISIYYDGVIIGNFALPRTSVGAMTSAFPTSQFTIPEAVGTSDSQEFIIFAEFPLNLFPRTYFGVSLFDSTLITPSAPSGGTVLLDVSTGEVFFSPDDLGQYVGWTFFYLHAAVVVERGVTFEAFRSGVNSIGPAILPDFTIRYTVTGQILQDGITAAPFVMLPTIPIVDDTLFYAILSGPSSTGSFSGLLFDGTNPSLQGLGYLLNLDQHQLKFSNRKTIDLTLKKASPVVKLPDQAISPIGLEVTMNGNPITPGVDFNFNPDTGLLEFIEPIGEDDPANILGIAGSVTLPNVFTAAKATFIQYDSRGFLFFPGGPNVGIYPISKIVSSTQVIIDGTLTAAGSDTADYRNADEIIADRFWTPFTPPYKKLQVYRGASHSGPFILLDQTEYSVQSTVGTISLTTAANPGEAFQVTYVYLSTASDGVTTVPVPITREFALFKIRQETAISTPGSNLISFNSSGDIVNNSNTNYPLQVAVNGLPLDPTAFTLLGNSSIQLAAPVKTGDVVVIDYWVENAPGGNTSFTLQQPPIELDLPQINQGVSTASFNGNQTSILSPGSAFFLQEQNVVIVQTVQYDPTADMTNVTFEFPPTVSTDPLNATEILVTGPITGSYRISEPSPADVFAKGTNTINQSGILNYRNGMIVTVNGDPYYIISVKHDFVNSRTLIITAAPAAQNYILPVLTRTVRPVLMSGSNFTTNLPLNVSFPITLILMGPNRSVLTKDVDYSVAEGGTITLTTALQFGDELYILYVARKSNPVGTQFTVNYSYAIAPSADNGLLTQQLVASYTLYDPDSFFYRIESFTTFLPEVIALLQQSAQSGGSSGPDTASRSSMKIYDFGTPSLYFPEQHAENVDSTIIRLLKYYNDLINLYEDLLANLDGRVVGGVSGRFRFDGNTNNPPRTGYGDITNDIDDEIVIFYIEELVGFYTFQLEPVYETMAVPNPFSRIFPTFVTATAALNSSVTFKDFGKTIGSFKVNQIISTSGITSSSANDLFTSASGSVLTVPTNGDPKNLLPPFVANEYAQVYADDGTPGPLAQVLSVTGTGPYTITLDTPTDFTSGSILQDFSNPMDTSNHLYVNGRDMIVSFDNGQITNFTFPPALSSLQNPPVGDEIVESFIVFVNTNNKPTRIPALDGLEKMDDGRVSQPQVRFKSESGLFALEQTILANFGLAMVTPNLSTLAGLPFTVAVGDVVQFIAGPNAGLSRTIQTLIGSTGATVSTPFTSLDSTGNDLIKVVGVSLSQVLTEELGVLHDNIPSAPEPMALIGTITSELTTADSIIQSYGTQLVASSGTAAATTLTDPSVDFIGLGVTAGVLIYVSSGANQGLYSVMSLTSHVLTLDTTSPFFGFPSAGSTSYTLIKLYSFLSSKGAKFMAPYLSKTLAFYQSTLAWASAPTPSAGAARNAVLLARLADVNNFIQQISSLLSGSDQLYNIRYLWIDHRTNRQDGTLTSLSQAVQTRTDNLVKLVEDQQKLLIAQEIAAM